MRHEAVRPAGVGGAWLVVVVVVGVALVATGAWWLLGSGGIAGGTPSLAVDREVIELGRYPFDKWARATFTLSNTGDGPLRILNDPDVSALKGC